MNVAAKALQGNKLAFDPSLDVNETAAIVLAAKRNVGANNTGKKKAGSRKGKPVRRKRFQFI
ncbi:deoxyhypusine synthase-like protein [compost metagenome]